MQKSNVVIEDPKKEFFSALSKVSILSNCVLLFSFLSILLILGSCASPSSSSKAIETNQESAFVCKEPRHSYEYGKNRVSRLFMDIIPYWVLGSKRDGRSNIIHRVRCTLHESKEDNKTTSTGGLEKIV
jgi:hypothetical protein